MNNLPWRAECELDERVVRDALGEQFPMLAIRKVAYLHEGWDSWAFLINGEWVFRFPKRRAVEDGLRRELMVLSLLGCEAKAVRIPRPEYIGGPGSAFPFAFFGYRVIEGTPGDRVDPASLSVDACAEQVGVFLGVLHSVSRDRVEGFALAEDEGGLRAFLHRVAALRDPILRALPRELHEPCAPFLDEDMAPPPPPPARRLIHNDLQAEHVIIDGGGTVAGVIDWGDVGLGDAAADFAGFYTWLGAPFTRRVLEAYPLSVDAAFWDRVEFRGKCLALFNLGWAVRGGQLSPRAALRMLGVAFRTA